MENEQLIPADALCVHYQLEQQFISSLKDAGLIEVTTIEEKIFLHPSQLIYLERYSRMHYDLRINIEGIEAIAHLLQRMNEMHADLNTLRNRLKVHDDL